MTGKANLKRKLGTRAAQITLAAVGALLALLAVTATASAAKWHRYDLQPDSHYYDAKAIDRDGNGRLDDIYFDLDDDGWWDTNLYNTRRSDRLLEVADYDLDENGEVELELRDGDGRVGFDYVIFDRDQDGYWDTRRGVWKFIIPGSNLDTANRANARTVKQMMSSSTFHQYTMQTGGSLLYPSFATP